MAVKDLMGLRFTKLKVVARAENTDDGRAQWLCECDCGLEIAVVGRYLTRSEVKSCGCLQEEKVSRSVASMLGKRYGRLVAQSASCRPRERNRIYFLCACDCGNETSVRSDSLKSGHIQSCGCLQREAKTTHGKSKSPEYLTWIRMRGRCSNHNNPSYRDYGGRGINVCERWANSFEAFLQDMGTRPFGHSIERIDVNGNYEPRNCRWATVKEQLQNKRKVWQLQAEIQKLRIQLQEKLDR